jgi:hypothetical protein
VFEESKPPVRCCTGVHLGGRLEHCSWFHAIPLITYLRRGPFDERDGCGTLPGATVHMSVFINRTPPQAIWTGPSIVPSRLLARCPRKIGTGLSSISLSSLFSDAADTKTKARFLSDSSLLLQPSRCTASSQCFHCCVCSFLHHVILKQFHFMILSEPRVLGRTPVGLRHLGIIKKQLAQHEPPFSNLKTFPSYLCSQSVRPATRLAARVTCYGGLRCVLGSMWLVKERLDCTKSYK